ncbi:MAG: transcriptional regulator, AraC family [Fibrobacteres bacterium]|nr:transcriptional regulator, AraC family [Fibrobacterota bacterium]
MQNDLARLFDHLPGIQFWIKDKEGRFVDANAAFLDHFGFTSLSQLAGRTDFDVSPPHLAQEYVQDDKSVLTSGKALANKMELVREKHGALHWYATTKVPLRDAERHIWGTAGTTRSLSQIDEGQARIRGLADVVQHIQENLGGDLSVTDLAEQAGLSVVQFERRFKSLFRETPLKFINRQRIRAACGLLLHTDLNVAEVSRRAGFSDQSYFTKRFFAHLRIRPLDYRRKYGPRSNSP